MGTKEVIWDANGGNPQELDTATINELVIYDLAKRNDMGQARFADFCGIESWRMELAFQRDGTSRSY